jgi:hypothetical protein
MIKLNHLIFLLSATLILNSCITQFIPQVTEDKEILVVEGLITNQAVPYTIKISRSLSLGTRSVENPVRGCQVTVTDDLGNLFYLNETSAGTYISNPALFHAAVGRFYTLHVATNSDNNNLRYESLPTEMKPVPPIDSIYYHRKTISESHGLPSEEGVDIFLDTHDATDKCKFFRWEYSETWEFRIPYSVPNKQCWISDNSTVINIKNTTGLSETRVDGYPLSYISNESDRLRVKYSMLVNQYSLNEGEYQYWEKLQNFAEQVGGLYDMIPSAVPSNVYCIDNQAEKVLGYFSVSATSSKRFFIKDNFMGIKTPYTDDVCIADTVFNGGEIQNLNQYVWIIVNHPLPPPSYVVTTRIKGCYDCTVRGTSIRPDFWNDVK